MVMNKLGSFVEKGRVVFIGLHNKTVTFSEARRDPKVQGYASDQKPRVSSCMVQNESEHAGCCRPYQVERWEMRAETGSILNSRVKKEERVECLIKD
jgi:hypothetical protein